MEICQALGRRSFRVVLVLTGLLFLAFHCILPVGVSAQILTQPVDSDGDGVADSKEVQGGTDPNDVDSLIELQGRLYCVDWNGFLSDHMQVMELRNDGCSALTLQTTQRDSGGRVRDVRSLSLAPAAQFDLIANALNGFQPQSYGSLCAEIISGDADTLGVRMSTYGQSADSFTHAASAAAALLRPGAQYVSYNNYFPLLDGFDQRSYAQGWVQVSSSESSVQTGKLIFYTAGGAVQKELFLTLPAHGRFDAPIPTFAESPVGVIEWRPDNLQGRFRVNLSRYYLAAGSPDGRLLGMVVLPASRATGHSKVSSFQTDSRLTVLELSNTLDMQVSVSLSVYEASGSLASSQPGAVVIPARGTYHLILNQFLPSGTGKVEFSANRPQSLVSALLEYGLTSQGDFVFANHSEPKTGFGLTERSSYNNFFGDCRLRLTNAASSQGSMQVALHRLDGTSLPFASPVQVPPHGVRELDLCSAAPPASYGGVTLTPDASETMLGEVIRENLNGTVEFKTTPLERSACAAELRLNTPSIVLVANGSPVAISLTNTSTGVTAENIDVQLPSGWGDVDVDATDCANLPPQASCSISFTPGSSVHAAASASVVGSNTSELLPIIRVNAGPSATISVAGSPLSLIENSTSKQLTVTNNSMANTAFNVSASFSGTALDGLVTMTGNTCATLAPGASCILTFAPGGTAVSQTSFTIQGTNTNAILAAIEILPAPMLTTITPNTGSASGGTGVTLSGVSLVGATSVTFDGVPATSVNVINSTTVTVVSPPHTAGAVDVEIATPAGSAKLVGGYVYAATAVGQSALGGIIGCLEGETFDTLDLVVSPTDNSSSIVWGASVTTGVVDQFDGAANTATLVSFYGDNGGVPYAAQVCDDYEVDSQGNTPCQAGHTCYDDWFLPAINQLSCLYTNKAALGSFTPTTYFASNEFLPTNVFTYNFDLGFVVARNKSELLPVRCTREFTPVRCGPSIDGEQVVEGC